jgi:hypothetical protein
MKPVADKSDLAPIWLKPPFISLAFIGGGQRS